MDTLFAGLFPQPRRIDQETGICILPVNVELIIQNAVQEVYPIALYLKNHLEECGMQPKITATSGQLKTKPITLSINADEADYVQGYRMQVTEDCIHIVGSDAPGLFYGVNTLVQLLTLAHFYEASVQNVPLPVVTIVDWPDFPTRGVMLDISRDKVPTLETLTALIDLLASWKINQLQLYSEHTFAYRGHELVWENASPLSGEDILMLDAYCRERYIDLVPNQNSFGHMHRWLKHEPYNHLAECPTGCELWPGYNRGPFSLCPTDPGALELITELYDQLLPHFSSTFFNVGLDETFDLGKGRSEAICNELGTERVYLEFLKKIHKLVSERGRTMQFWGDIILHRPDLIGELPQIRLP